MVIGHHHTYVRPKLKVIRHFVRRPCKRYLRPAKLPVFPALLGKHLSPSQRRGAPFQALARGEGTNSARLFTPWERNALAKSKVNQIPWAHSYDPRVDLLTDLKNMAVCQEWDKHTEYIKARFQFSKAYIGSFQKTSIPPPQRK